MHDNTVNVAANVTVDHDVLGLSSTQMHPVSMQLKRLDLTPWMGKRSTPSVQFLKECVVMS
jgi:hypothetical protein